MIEAHNLLYIPYTKHHNMSLQEHPMKELRGDKNGANENADAINKAQRQVLLRRL